LADRLSLMPILPERIRRLTELFMQQTPLDPMEARIEKLEERCWALELNLSTLKAALEPTPVSKKPRKKS
jgi:hypothetical protein